MKKSAVLVALLLLMTLIAGCGSSGETPAPSGDGAAGSGEAAATAEGGDASDDKTYIIGYAVNDFNDKWTSYVVDNAREWGEEHANVQVVMGNGDTDINTQLALIEDWIEQGFDAIVVKPVDVEASVAMAQKAKAAGIPYVAVQQDIDEADAYVGPDAIKCGEIQTQAVVDALGGTGKILYMSGEPGSLASRQREEGFMNIVNANEGIEVVGNEIGNWLRSEALTIMENWIAAGIEFDAVVCACDEMSIGAILAMEAAGIKEGKLVAGIDGTPDALQMMIEGRLDITMYADPVGLAKEALDCALRLAMGEPVEDVPLDDLLVLPDQAEEYLAKW